MKIIDKFIKKLGTDRNTFATYLFTIISAYVAIDRIVEMLLMIFTGVSHSYWGPIEYILALACPVLAFAFMPKSKFAATKAHRVSYFYVYAIVLYVIAISMFTQWLNMGAWLLLLSVPNYVELITDFSHLVTPAFVSISLYLPLATAYPMFKWLYFGVNDSKDNTRSIWDYGGINLSDKSKGKGPYTCEAYICTDFEYNKKIVMPEESRYQSLFVCGGSGSGKTSLVFEPLIAKDIERKYFFREVSKELGYAALKTNLATISKPYSNDFLNKNFSLSMVKPNPEKASTFKTLVKNMILSSHGGETVYRNVGCSVMSPDNELITNMINVCKNYDLDYDLLDPSNPDISIGLNPFVFESPTKIAVTISGILRTLYLNSAHDMEDAYKEEVSVQAIENIAILLKEMYPRMNDGLLPNMDDLLKMLTNYALIEKMCEIMSHDEHLREKYYTQIAYFKKNFYASSSNTELTEKYLYTAVSQLDNLLRIPGVKAILCNRYNNINFDDTLANGKITFVSTRRGEIGGKGSNAFGLFYLISMQNSVLARPGTESSRTPYFLYIDEFPEFLCKATDPIFTMYRKYKVGTTIATQSLSQLGPDGNPRRNNILANCASKIFTGNGEFNEVEWWSKEFGKKRDWTFSNNMDTTTMQYESKLGNVKWEFVDNFKPGKLQTLGQKQGAFKIRDAGGKPMVGLGVFSYMDSKYKEPQKPKHFDFGKYMNNSPTDTDEIPSQKFNAKKVDFLDHRNEYDPVQTDSTDVNYVFDESDPIVSGKKKKNNWNN